MSSPIRVFCLYLNAQRHERRGAFTVVERPSLAFWGCVCREQAHLPRVSLCVVQKARIVIEENRYISFLCFVLYQDIIPSPCKAREIVTKSADILIIERFIISCAKISLKVISSLRCDRSLVLSRVKHTSLEGERSRECDWTHIRARWPCDNLLERTGLLPHTLTACLHGALVKKVGCSPSHSSGSKRRCYGSLIVKASSRMQLVLFRNTNSSWASAWNVHAYAVRGCTS